MRRNIRQSKPTRSPLAANPRPDAEAVHALERMLQDFWEVHQKIIGKIERCESPSPEEIAEATLDQRSLTERRRQKREESAKAARQLLDSIDLEP